MKRLIDYSSRFRILKGGKISLVVSAMLGSSTLSFASPSQGIVTSGSATISQNGTVTNIDQSSAKASINWQTFSIATNETVNFNQPDASSITLNRVVGNEKSVIDGALNANGQVWLLNSNGILFSKNAKVNTAGILATTAQLSDEDFQNGNYEFKNSSSNSVINQGTIEVSNAGAVVLASNEVINEGTIKATLGKVHLVGADSYSINLNGNSLVNLRVDKGVLDAMVENSGHIVSDGGEIYLTTNAVDELLKGVVNNTGIIEANSLDALTGKVELFAHGGTAEIDGIIKAEGYGSDDGGFIETSGKDINIQENFKVSTLSENGKTGTWLIDPTDITITNGGGNDVTASSMDADAITTALASNNLILEATNDIAINESINSTNANSLTFKAGRNIEQSANTNITTAGGDVIFWSDSDSNGEGRIRINEGSNIETNGGDIVLAGGVDSNADGIPDGYASGYTTKSIGVWLYGESGNTINLSSSGGNIIIKGKSSSILGTNPDYNNQNGILSRHTVLSSDAGNIDLDGISIGDGGLTQGILFSSSSSMNTSSGDITLTGTGSSTGSNRYWGIRFYDGASITSGGNLVMTGIAGADDREGISQDSGTISVAGTTTINAGSYDIDLTSTTNDFTGAVTVTQANDVSIVDANDLTLGSVSSTGIVDISALTNNLTVSDDISGTSVTLNAGKNTAAGTSTGGDIIISGAPTITASTENTKLYTGSISGSTGLTSLVGSGSGNFRYNSDETTTNFTSALDATGLYAIYREQPSITLTASDTTKTYDGLAFSGGNGVTGFLNGDSTSQLTGTLSYSGTSQGATNAGNYIITPSGLTDTLGYAISYADGNLTINKKEVTFDNVAALDRPYDGTTDTLIMTGQLEGLIGNEALTTLSFGTFDSKDAGSRTATATHTLGDGWNGGIASNYYISDTTGLSATIFQKDLTASYTADNKVYDGTTDAGVNGNSNDIVSGDIVTFTQSAAFSDKDAGTGKTVNVSGITLGGTDASNYNLTSATASTTANITPKDLTASYTADNKVYDGTTDAIVSGNSNEIVSGDTVTFTQSAAFSDKDAGTGKTVNISSIVLGGIDASNYNLLNNTASATGTITPKEVTFDNVAALDRPYDGTTDTLIMTGQLEGLIGNEALTTLSFGTFDSKDAGSRTATATHTLGDGWNGGIASNYYISDTTGLSATIFQKELTITGTTAADKIYDGTTDVTETVGTLSGFIGTETVTATAIGTFDNEDVGTRTATFAYTLDNGTNGGIASNYSLADTTDDADIDKADATVTANSDTTTYNGLEQTVSGFTASGFVNGETISVLDGVSTTGGIGTNAGEYTLTASGSDENYNLTFIDGKLTIEKADATVTANSDTTTYNGLEQTVSGFTASGLVNGETISVLDGVSTTGGAGTNAGEYTLTASGTDGNYNLTFVDGKLTIEKADATVTADDRTKTYGDSITLGTNAFTSSGLQNSETIGSVTLSSANSYDASTTQDAGTYEDEVIISSASGGTFNINNYDVTYVAGDLDITKKALSVNYIGTNKIYDGTNSAIVTDTLSGVINSDTVTVSETSVFDNVNAGNNKNISISNITLGGADAGNYSIGNTSSTTADITKANLTVTANDDAKFVTQNDPTFTASYSGFVGGDDNTDLGGALSIARLNSGTNTAGTYSGVLEASGYTSSNYTISYVNGDYAIVPADELLVRVINVSDTYGTATQYTLSAVEYYNGSNVVTLGAGTGTTRIDANNLVSITDGAGGTATFTVAPQNSLTSTAGKLSVGSYQLGVSGTVTENSANFSDTVTIVGAHQVNQKNITASASGITKVYDGTTDMTNVSVELATLESGDVVTVSGNGQFGTANAGNGISYNISGLNLLGADAANYYLSGGTSLSGSNGEITKADATVTANSDTVTYNGTSQSVSGFTASGLVNGETISVLSGVSTIGGAGTNAGEYTLTANGTDGNYNLTFVDGKLTIEKADVTVTTNDFEKFVGQDDPTFTYNTTGLIGNDTLSGNITREVGEAIGEYLITQGTLANDNYNISFNNGTFTIVSNIDPTQIITVPIVVINQPVTNAQEISIQQPTTPAGNTPTGSNRVNLASTPIEDQATTLVSLGEIKENGSQGSSGDVIVPLNKNSVISLVNGGVKLVDGLEQQFFVVNNEENQEEKE